MTGYEITLGQRRLVKSCLQHGPEEGSKNDGAVVELASAGSLDVWRYSVVLVCLAALACGQSVELGVIGGVPVTEAYETGTDSHSHPCNVAAAKLGDTAVYRRAGGPDFAATWLRCDRRRALQAPRV